MIGILNSEYSGFYKIEHEEIRGSSKIYVYGIGYSNYYIEPVEVNEQAPKGDAMIPINDDLGDYVIRVRLSDSEVSKTIAEKYEEWTTYQLNDSSFYFMYASDSSTHAADIYIGSNEPIDINNISVKGIGA